MINILSVNMIIIGCLPSWAKYKGYTLDDIPQSVTHLTYCFIGCTHDGLLRFMDPWADLGREEQVLIYTENMNITSGTLFQLRSLKASRPSIKIGLSVGGSGCKDIETLLTLPATTMRLADSIVSLFDRLELDYIDFDFEYPINDQMLSNYILLISKFKAKSGRQVFLSTPCDTKQLMVKNIQLFTEVDYFVMMAYDLSGSWSEMAEYHSNLYRSRNYSICIESVISKLSEKIDKSKIILGIPLFGKQFENCCGIGEDFSSVDCVDYDDIPMVDTYYDENCVAAHVVTSSNSIIVFDDAECIRMKMKYSKENGLAGVMFWDLSKCKSLSRVLKSIANNL